MGIFDSKEKQKQRETRFKEAHPYYSNAEIGSKIGTSEEASHLDNLAYASVKHPRKFEDGVFDKIDKKGMRHLSDKDNAIYIDMLANDKDKEAGKGLYKLGTEGRGHTYDQMRKASFKERALNLAHTANPLGSGSINTAKEAFGFSPLNTKILGTKGAGMDWLTHRALLPLGSALMMANTITDSENPLNDTLALGAASWAGTGGYRVGKAAFSTAVRGGEKGLARFGTHIGRMASGGILGATGAALGYAAIAGFADMGSNESFIASTAKSIYSKESEVNDYQSRQALTMRQAGLEKLSSSSLNNRGQLLGNEADILRSLQF